MKYVERNCTNVLFYVEKVAIPVELLITKTITSMYHKPSSYHIFLEIQVYSSGIPSQDELSEAHQEMVWSQPIPNPRKDISLQDSGLKKSRETIIFGKQIKTAVKNKERNHNETCLRYLQPGCLKILYICEAKSIASICPSTQYLINASLQENIIFRNQICCIQR